MDVGADTYTMSSVPKPIYSDQDTHFCVCWIVATSFDIFLCRRRKLDGCKKSCNQMRTARVPYPDAHQPLEPVTVNSQPSVKPN